MLKTNSLPHLSEILPRDVRIVIAWGGGDKMVPGVLKSTIWRKTFIKAPVKHIRTCRDRVENMLVLQIAITRHPPG